MKWALRDMHTGRWAIDNPPTMFTERVAEACTSYSPYRGQVSLEVAVMLYRPSPAVFQDAPPQICAQQFERVSLKFWALCVLLVIMLAACGGRPAPEPDAGMKSCSAACHPIVRGHWVGYGVFHDGGK